MQIPADRSASIYPHPASEVQATGDEGRLASLVNNLTPDDRRRVLALLLGSAGPGVNRRTPTPAPVAPMGGMMPLQQPMQMGMPGPGAPPPGAPPQGGAPMNPMASAFANRRPPPR